SVGDVYKLDITICPHGENLSILAPSQRRRLRQHRHFDCDLGYRNWAAELAITLCTLGNPLLDDGDLCRFQGAAYRHAGLLCAIDELCQEACVRVAWDNWLPPPPALGQ